MNNYYVWVEIGANRKLILDKKLFEETMDKCAQCGIDSVILSIKDTTGFTLTDYIQMTRVRNVQSLLINTDIPITDAALTCGFTSFSQFNRVFRKHIGMAPSQFRKQYGAG